LHRLGSELLSVRFS